MEKKTILITGSNKGLGKELALIFAKNNYNIIIHGRNKADLDNVKAELEKLGSTVEIVVGDLQDSKTIEELSNKAKENNIDILINNAGIMSVNLGENNTDEEINEVINTNLISPIRLTTRIYSHFLEKKSGIIININSSHGIMTAEKHSLYCATKHGLKGYSDSLRAEAKPNNIRVIDIHPAGMWTTFFERVGGRKSYDKTMRPNEVAKCIFNLIGPESVHVNELVLSRMYAK